MPKQISENTGQNTYAETVEECIYRLKLEGYAHKDIAVRTDKSVEDVEEIIVAMAERSRQRLLAELSVGTIMEVDRIDTMHRVLWAQASGGDLSAIRQVMDLSKERRKLLGLDAPAGIGNPKKELDLSTLTDVELLEYERLQQKLMGASSPKRLGTGSKRKRNENVIEVDVE